MSLKSLDRMYRFIVAKIERHNEEVEDAKPK